LATFDFLIGVRFRLTVAISWLWSLLFRQNPAGLITQKETDGVNAPRRHRCAMVAGVEASLQKGASMGEVSIIGLDLAKNVFQAHGAGADGSVVFQRKLSQAQLLKFMAAQPSCAAAMEACASAHHWGRAIGDPVTGFPTGCRVFRWSLPCL
jgi:hypothetical protein